MAGSINKVTLVGRLGKAPEARSLGGDRRVVTFSLATSESWKDKRSGERVEKTEWHTVQVFNEPLGKIVEQYVNKGDLLYVEGSIQTRKWSDKDGNERQSTEIVVPAFRGDIQILSNNKGGKEEGGSSTQSRGKTESKQTSYAEDLSDEIPF